MKRLHEYIKSLVNAEIPKEGLNPGVIENMRSNARPIAVENMLNDIAEKIESLEKQMKFVMDYKFPDVELENECYGTEYYFQLKDDYQNNK